MIFTRRPSGPARSPREGGARRPAAAPRLEDYESWAALREESRAFLQPWEPTWPADDLTRAAYKRRMRRYDAEIDRDEAYPYFCSTPPAAGCWAAST